MTLQQLRYLLAIAKHGSISSAAHELYISQSSLSIAVKDIEGEYGIRVFDRSSKGITLTDKGRELLGYARQVVEHADMMDAHYLRRETPIVERLCVSSQHHAFPVEAFVDFVNSHDPEKYTFCLKETQTSRIIADVRDYKSDLGVLCMSDFNEGVISRILEDAGLVFHRLFQARPHVFLGKGHVLSSKKSLNIEDLHNYPRYSFEQGASDSLFLAEEPFAELEHDKKIIVNDRGTLSNLLAHHFGYIISTGILASEMGSSVVSVPLKTDEMMVVGYVVSKDRQPCALAMEFIETLRLFIEDYNKGFAAL